MADMGMGDMSGMNMDHSSMQGMQQGSMPGMDHGAMPGMSHGSTPGTGNMSGGMATAGNDGAAIEGVEVDNVAMMPMDRQSEAGDRSRRQRPAVLRYSGSPRR